MAKKDIVPFNPENEMVILSAMMRDGGLMDRLARELTKDLFIAQRNRIIFEVLQDMDGEGLTFDLDTFSQMSGEVEFGGLKYIKSLVNLFDGGQNIDYHLKILRRDKLKMELILGPVATLTEVLGDPTSDIADVMDAQRAVNTTLGGSVDRGSVQSGEQVGGDYFNEVTDRIAGKSLHFVPLNLEKLDDNIVEGQARKKLSVIFGRPRMGKSTLVSSIIVNKIQDAMKKHRGNIEAIAADPKLPRHLICPLEMGNFGLMDSIISNMAGVEAEKILKYPTQITPQEKKRIKTVIDIMKKTNLVSMLDKPGLRLKDLPAILASGEYGVVWFDLWEKMVMDKTQDVISSHLNYTQDLAKEFNVHIVIVHQASRLATMRDGGRPTLQDLKNSGAYEEVADLVIGINRPYFSEWEAKKRKRKNDEDQKPTDVDYMELCILKQRKGPALKRWFKFEFDGEYNRVGNYIHSISLESPVVEVDSGS